MTQQQIRIDALGRVVSAYKDDNPVDLSKIGPQKIERFSEVLHDEHLQKFYVVFKEGAPRWLHGVPLNWDLHHSFLGTYPDQDGMIMHKYQRHRVVVFDTYADAVVSEQLVLGHLMRTGEV